MLIIDVRFGEQKRTHTQLEFPFEKCMKPKLELIDLGTRGYIIIKK